MHREFQCIAFVTGLAAVILSVGCNPATTYTYAGPVLTTGSSGASSCPGCSITGTFTVNNPLGFAGVLNTFPSLGSTGALKSFDFTISGFTGTPQEWSSTNGATIRQFGVSLDHFGNLGNWNIIIVTGTGPAGFATCNITAGFASEFPAPPAPAAGFPSGAACTQPPGTDIFFPPGGGLAYGQGPGTWTAK
jgi:hypothetical protein